MLSDIKQLIEDENISLALTASGEPTTREFMIAATFVIFSAAKIDDEFSDRELIKIVSLLGGEFGLEDFESGEILETVELLHNASSQLEGYTAQVNGTYSTEQKQKLLSLVWRVILSDHEILPSESKFAINLRTILGLTLEQAAVAQAQAEMDLR
ncbi:MAG: TerB family tellurite resistance protein [bacterium]|nr:TerB family tellurite resistance protein [bacterium]